MKWPLIMGFTKVGLEGQIEMYMISKALIGDKNGQRIHLTRFFGWSYMQ